MTGKGTLYNYARLLQQNLYEAPEKLDYGVHDIFETVKLRTLDDFLSWWEWLSRSFRSFQVCDNTMILFDKELNNTQNSLVRTLILQSVDEKYKNKEYANYTAIHLLTKIIADFKFFQKPEVIQKLNEKFTVDKSIPMHDKLREWRLLSLMNNFNNYKPQPYLIQRHIYTYAVDNGIYYPEISELPASVESAIIIFYGNLFFPSPVQSTPKAEEIEKINLDLESSDCEDVNTKNDIENNNSDNSNNAVSIDYDDHNHNDDVVVNSLKDESDDDITITDSKRIFTVSCLICEGPHLSKNCPKRPPNGCQKCGIFHPNKRCSRSTKSRGLKRSKKNLKKNPKSTPKAAGKREKVKSKHRSKRKPINV